MSWIKEYWKGALAAVQRYITGEGRFIIVHCYHLHFLMHLSGGKEINLPYYLLKILTKMAKRVQIHSESTHRSLYYQGLIKLLVYFSLEELEIPWGYFLKYLGLKEKEEVSDSHIEGDASKYNIDIRVVITLNCTIHSYLASGHLRSLLCQSIVEQLFKNPLL
jgi:hypothetical protein